MGTEDDVTRDALAEVAGESLRALRGVLWEAFDGSERLEGCTRQDASILTDAVLAAGYLPPDQADALRTEAATWRSWYEGLSAQVVGWARECHQANARAEQQASAVEAVLVECENAVQPPGGGNDHTVPARQAGRHAQKALIGRVRAALTPDAADAHDRRVRAEAWAEGAREALLAAADAARGMHDPVAPDCAWWADWLVIRAALDQTGGGQ